MPTESGRRRVVILAPMPLEMDAIVAAFGLTPISEASGAPCTGQVGQSDVTALHIGMGPTLTRAATERLFADPSLIPDHVMNAGICGGLDPDLAVGTLLNPEFVMSHSSGIRYQHTPPGNEPLVGTLVTTEAVHFDHDLSRRFFEEGCLGVDMESAAVAEVCEAHGCPWSIYRCIGDRYFDGLLDERVAALANPDGSGNMDELARLLTAEPDVAAKLEQLSRDTASAARLAAEAAVRGCLALDD